MPRHCLSVKGQNNRIRISRPPAAFNIVGISLGATVRSKYTFVLVCHKWYCNLTREVVHDEGASRQASSFDESYVR